MTKRRWLVLAFTAGALLLANATLSGALELGWARRSLLARLATSFGRPVDVGRFRLSLLDGLRLEADSVTVSEDEHFGHEYFLRAERLSAGLRWSALLRGRIEFGVVSLTRPSLNLVRLPDGSWNVESWLPPPAPIISAAKDTTAPMGASRVAARLSRLDVDGGRINFKRGDEKLPFGLVDVTGYVEQDPQGRWTIDLQADPMRTPVPLQNAGTLRLVGTVAGTTERLRPAAFSLTWQDASLADSLRLLEGSDYGVRGVLSAQISATVGSSAASTGAENAAAKWDFFGTVRLSDVHRWDLGESSLDPAVNLDLTASWRPSEPRLSVASFVVEAPRSHMNASGSLDWSRGINPNIQLASSMIGLGDLVDWLRAFSPRNVAGLSADGVLALDGSMAGWPLRLQRADATINGAVVRAQALPGPLRVGRVEAHLRQDTLAFGPAEVSLPGIGPKAAARGAPEPTPAGELQIAGSLGPMRPSDGPRDWRYSLSVSGATQRAQDLVALAGAFRASTNADWSVQGPVALHLAWSRTLKRGSSIASGALELHNLQLSTVALNKPVIVGAATVAVNGAERQIRFDQVQAFGGSWAGALHRGAGGSTWDFDVSADRLDAADLDLWLGPAGRPSLFDRLLPFAAPRESTPARAAIFAHLAANGHLRVGEVLFSRLRAGKLDTQAEINGRSVMLEHAQADFYGGRVSGELKASLVSTPSYAFRGRIDRVDLGSLADATNSLPDRLAGLAAGELSLSAHGIGRQALAASLEGEGVLRLRNVMIRGLDLGDDRPHERGPVRITQPSGRAGESDSAAESRYGSAAAAFHVGGSLVRVDQVLLVGRDEQFEVDGTVDFARQMNLRARSVPRDAARPAESDSQDAEADVWSIGGSLDAPQVRLETPVAVARPLPSAARRR